MSDANGLTLMEAARKVGRSYETVRTWALTGIKIGRSLVKLRAEFVGARIYVPEGAIEEFLAACKAVREQDLRGPLFVPPETPAEAAARGKEAVARALATLDEL